MYNCTKSSMQVDGRGLNRDDYRDYINKKLHVSLRLKVCFVISHGAFKRLELQTRKNKGLYGKELSPNPLPFARTWFIYQIPNYLKYGDIHLYQALNQYINFSIRLFPQGA